METHLIIHSFISIGITVLLLTGKAFFDVYRQKRGKWVEHTIEWLLLFGIILNVVFFSFGAYWYQLFFWKEVISDLILLGGIGWIFFDLIHNKFSGEKLDYVSPPSVHQSLSDKFLTIIGVKYQYLVKGFALFLAIGIDYLILK